MDDSIGFVVASVFAERGADAEPVDGDGLLEALAQRGGGVGVEPVELAGQLVERGAGLGGVGLGPSGREPAADPALLRGGQVADDVLGLMATAALDLDRVAVEHRLHCRVQGFGAIEDEQHAP